MFSVFAAASATVSSIALETLGKKKEGAYRHVAKSHNSASEAKKFGISSLRLLQILIN